MVQWHSLRRSVLVAGTAAAALLVTGAAGAAGGSPAPAPDDPPPGLVLGESTPTRARAAAPADVASRRPRVAAPASIPTPDAPLVETPPAAAAPVPTTKTARPRTTPASSPTRPTPVRTAVSRFAGQSRRSRASAPVATTTRPPSPARKGRRVSAPRVPSPRRSAPEQTARPVPRDAIRVALPVGTIEVARPDVETNAGLLAAAGFLLGVAAAGTAVVGIAVRGIARPA